MKTAYIPKQRQISFVKSHFSRQLEERLGLIEVQAPILSRVGDGTQDNLSGCEKAVQVKVKQLLSLLSVDTVLLLMMLLKLKRPVQKLL